MGVTRCPVECPGCHDKITLRLGVGHDERQPFFYVCGRCLAATKGTLLLDLSGNGPLTRIELEAGSVLDSYDGCSQTIHINPELPSVPHAEGFWEPGGSAFIFHVQTLGPDKMAFFQQQVGKFDAFVKGGWPALKRLTAYYLNQDWEHFDTGLDQLVEGTPKLTEQWQRDDLIHKIYDHAFIPILALGPRHYPDMKMEWNALWDGKRPNFAAMAAFAEREARTNMFK
jgi:hypothetical protein